MARPFDFSRATQDQARLRQDGMCAHCASGLDDLVEHAHHVIPNQSGDPKNTAHAWLKSVDNCVVLCDLCHERVHEDGRYQKGAVAEPGYYPYSHGRKGSAQHRSWENALNARADALFRGTGSPASQARTDKPWAGPGGTPGFNPSRIQGVASALALFQQWAEQLSMLSAAIAAWNELLEREAEITAAQSTHPESPVYIRIYWKVHGENNPNLPKRYEYFGAEIANTISGTAAMYDGWQKSYLMVIPPLKTAPKVLSQAPTTWRDRYVSVVSAAQGDRSHGGDPVAALRLLNGWAMFDILPILDTLKTSEPSLFSKLEQAIQWPTADVGRGRLTAAFVAVRTKDGGHSAFLTYVNACADYHHLPDDQKNEIQAFIASASKKVSLDAPTGEWTVRVAHWVWNYKFADGGGVTWRDPFNGMNGKGKWTTKESAIRIDWIGSTTVDEWDLPLDPKTQSGKTWIKGQKYKLTATKA